MAANDPAFPFVSTCDGYNVTFPGISKRELFAAMAMQGMLAHPTDMDGDGNPIWPSRIALAGTAVHYADLLLDALKEGEE